MQNELSDRFLEFGANIIKLTTNLYKTPEGRHIGGQLLRSGTSSGANYEEACGAESRRDFIHKLQITLKELKESFYWLRLIRKAALFSEKSPLLSSLLEKNTNDRLKKLFPLKCAERTEIHRISSYGLYVHFVVILKNTKNMVLSATLGDFGVIRWENYTAATIRLTDFKYD